MDSIATAIFDALLNIVNVFLNIIFSPLDRLLGLFFDGLFLSGGVTTFYYVLNQYVVPLASFFVDLVPPLTWSIILLHFTIVIGLYSIALTMHYILKPLHVVKKIIPFT